MRQQAGREEVPQLTLGASRRGRGSDVGGLELDAVFFCHLKADG